jgi:hypothetical protein
MNKTTYRKEDLIWEATRRSEGYKQLFKSEIGENTKTDLAMDFFRLNFPADPNLGIDKIEEKIASGADPKEVHPYHGFFERKEEPVAHRPIPDFVYQHWYEHFPLEQDGTDTRATNKEQFEIWFDLLLKQMPGRILISIDPKFSNREIFPGIAEIKRKAVEDKKAVGKDKQLSPRTYFPRDIGKYIDWLKTYDEIVATARKEKLEVTADGSILTLPDSFSFKLMVPDELIVNGKKSEIKTVVRKYRNIYGEATYLISVSPFVSFSNVRNQK